MPAALTLLPRASKVHAMKHRLAAAGILTVLTLHAENLTTTTGKTYLDVKIIRKEDNGIRIEHKDGSGKIPFFELPESLRRKYGYDPEKAADQTRIEAENARVQKERMAKAAEERNRLQEAASQTPEKPPAPPAAGAAAPTTKTSDWFQKKLYSKSPLDGHQYFSSPHFTKQLSTLPNRPLSAEERRANARTFLVISIATRFAAHHYQPETDTEKWVKALAKFGSDYGIGQSLEVLFPDSSSMERAAIEGAIGAITELKTTPNEITNSMIKSALSDQLKQRDPNLALSADIAGRLWDVVNESVKGTGG